MKIILANSKEYLALYLKEFLKERGHEVYLLQKGANGVDELDYEALQNFSCDAIINFPAQQVINQKKGPENFSKEFFDTRINPTQELKEHILKLNIKPKVWISFSSIAIYPKEIEKLYDENDLLGEDITAKLVQKWEEAAHLELNSVRKIILRAGLLISLKVGILAHLKPLFKFGLGSVIGKGPEPFPWIYIKDLCWFILYALENEAVNGVYNTVAPQLITSKNFSKALAITMNKRIFLKLSKNYFKKKLGDVAEIVLAGTKVYPSRILETGFRFRYPAIYPSLVDAFSKN